MDFIDPIFNMHKVKFDIMDNWQFVDKKATRAIVYINLENVFRLLMTPRTSNFIQASASMDTDDYMKKFSLSLVSNIINLGQHYRLWLTKQNMDSRIVLYWNYPIPDEYINQRYIPTYRTTHNERYKGNMEMSCLIECLDEAYKFIQTCIQYVNEVYLINPGKVESSLIPLLLDREVYQEDGLTNMNILVTTNPYEYSYVDYGFHIIAPAIKKKTPLHITQKNVIEALKDKSGVSSVLNAPPDLLEFIAAIMGDSDRSIGKISGVGIATVLKLINVAIDKGIITEHTKDIDMLKGILKGEYVEVFRRNYHCTNFEYQLKDVEPLDVHKIKSCLVDNYDENTLNEMNEKYFKLFPIDIIKPKSQQVLYDNNASIEASIFAKK